MFSVYCPTHGGEILLSHRHIQRVHNTDRGIVVHWRCVCGTQGTTATGRRSPRRAPFTA